MSHYFANADELPSSSGNQQHHTDSDMDEQLHNVSIPAIDYHTDFEFEHHESDVPPENDIISRERLPSSDSFKDEEALKPLEQYSMMGRSGESFLKHDTGIDDPNRIIFFTTQRNLELLKASDYWGINCVTKKVPRPFVQCWVIHGFYRLKSLSFAYFLVRSTNDSTFERAMKLLPEDVLPKHVMMDHLRKEYKLAQTLFPDAKFHLCYFYFTGSVMRKIASYFYPRYRQEEQYHIDVKAFMMLAFVKPADVVRYFNVLKEIFNGVYNDSANLNEFLAYMEDTWIGNPEIGKAPVHPIELWNVHDSTVNEFPRTNNFFKTWLGRFYPCFKSAFHWEDEPTVTVHAFIDAIKYLQRSDEFIVDRINLGFDLPHFRKLNADMLKVVLEYDNYQPLEYLRAVSAASIYHKKSKKKEQIPSDHPMNG